MTLEPIERKAIKPGLKLIRHALNQLLSSKTFASSSRRRSFLQFVVEAELSGKGGSIKSYTIGTEALDRPTSFDPTADASVRVEATRVRKALTDYYRTEGAQDPVMIMLAPGSYVPEYFWRNDSTHASGMESLTAALEQSLAAHAVEESRNHLSNLRAQTAKLQNASKALLEELSVSKEIIERSNALIPRKALSRPLTRDSLPRRKRAAHR